MNNFCLVIIFKFPVNIFYPFSRFDKKNHNRQIIGIMIAFILKLKAMAKTATAQNKSFNRRYFTNRQNKYTDNVKLTALPISFIERCK